MRWNFLRTIGLNASGGVGDPDRRPPPPEGAASRIALMMSGMFAAFTLMSSSRLKLDHWVRWLTSIVITISGSSTVVATIVLART